MIKSWMRFGIAISAALGLSSSSVKADEGMWLPLHIKRLNHTDMQKHGLKLSADEIYNVNTSSLKDAIVHFGGFCTGEVISGQSLILTNHHCGFDLIQNHSTVANNYLQNGFWAKTQADELPNPGLKASFLVRMEDVTAKVLPLLNDKMTEEERARIITRTGQDLVKQATAGTHYNGNMRSFFNGNEFYLFIYETFEDVRLVGAPPSSIGKFGGETDNWMWPRHTGDFSMFRIYANKDGKPAPYSKDNVPLKPRHFLPISMSGIKEGDFSMIMGYPGRTDRFLTSFGVKMAIDISNPERVDIRRRKLDVIEEFSAKDPATKILYASKYAQISNYWKNFIGQTRGLKKLNVASKKEQIEREFTAWVNADPARKAKYAEALPLIAASYEKIKTFRPTELAFGEAIMGSGMLSASGELLALHELYSKTEKVSDADIAQAAKKAKENLEEDYTEYNEALERKMLGVCLERFYFYVPDNFRSEALKSLEKKYKGDWQKAANALADKSFLTNKALVNAFLEKPSAKALAKDPIFSLYKSIYDVYAGSVSPLSRAAGPELEKGNRLFVAGLLEMNKDKKVYAPNANSTMRLTYGNVLSYSPQDAVIYKYYTTLDGVMEKEDPKNPEFEVPARLKELWQKKDYGPYGENGTMPVAFLSNLDITGGNSGSPVINGNGELIGLAFDGNWEAMSGDIAFEPELQRTISNDIRYILFIIDKYAGATNLISEMKLVYAKAEEPKLIPAPATPAMPAVAPVKESLKTLKPATAPKVTKSVKAAVK